MTNQLKTACDNWVYSDEIGTWVPNPELSDSAYRRLSNSDEAKFIAWIKPDINGNSEYFNVAMARDKFPEKANQMGGNGSGFFTRGKLGNAFELTQDTKKEDKGNRITHRRFSGVKLTSRCNQPIRKDLDAHIKRLPCAVLGTLAQVETDHKDGTKSDQRLNDLSLQTVEDFQPLHKTVNNVKREACKKCVNSGCRFDATDLGFAQSYAEGDESLEASGCKGCFWYDPVAFRATVSKAEVEIVEVTKPAKRLPLVVAALAAFVVGMGADIVVETITGQREVIERQR